MAILPPKFSISTGASRPFEKLFMDTVLARAADYRNNVAEGYELGVIQAMKNQRQTTYDFTFKLKLWEVIDSNYTKRFTERALICLDSQNIMTLVAQEADFIFSEMVNGLHEYGLNNLGSYPDVRAWAIHKGMLKKGDVDPGFAIPGFVWKRWHAAFPDKDAVATGGLTQKGSTTVTTPATPASKPTVKVTKGALTKKPVKKPTCPVHNIAMVLDTEENIWKCRETGCELIFRPKQEERVAGSILLGKGNVTLKVLPNNQFVLITDDNVAIDISPYIANIDMKIDTIDITPMGSHRPAIMQNDPTIDVTFRGLNIVRVNS